MPAENLRFPSFFSARMAVTIQKIFLQVLFGPENQ
jgi:hypothetical protein